MNGLESLRKRKPIPEAPASLYSKMGQERRTQSLQVDTSTDFIIPEGVRDETLFHKARLLQKEGIEGKILESILLEINETQCQPPLTQKQVLKIARQAPQYVEKKKHALTEVGDANRFAEKYGNKALFCPELQQWYIWEGGYWQPDTRQRIFEMVLDSIRAFHMDGLQHPDKDKGHKICKYALKAESNQGLNNIVRISEKVIPELKAPLSDFDTHKNLLCVKNGIVDLKTGKLFPPDPSYKITKQAPFAYNPGATCPRFIQFLQEVFQLDQALIDFLQRGIGYTLTGHTGQRCIFFLHGTGANGKSTLMNVFRRILGPYVETISTDTLMRKKYDSAENDLARLPGVRLAMASEGEEGQRLAASRIKQLSGGDTPIVAKLLFKDKFSYIPEFKLWFDTNALPRVDADDVAIWDRMKLIPFNARFEGSAQISRDVLDAELMAEAEGILSWMVHGAVLWYQDGLKDPDSVKHAVDGYRSEMDLIAEFIEDKCDTDTSFSVSASALYTSYREWCTQRKLFPVSANKFGRSLKAKGFTSHKTSGYRAYRGLRLHTTS